jgi:hypothetical protein
MEEMPEDCIVCRMVEKGEEGLREKLRERNERRMLEENVLEGLRGLGSVFGGSMCRRTMESVEGRIEEVRREWRGDVEDLCLKFEMGEGRTGW